MDTRESSKLHFKNCTILHPHSGTLESNKCITVSGNRIESITDESPADAIDARGLTVGVCQQ